MKCIAMIAVLLFVAASLGADKPPPANQKEYPTYAYYLVECSKVVVMGDGLTAQIPTLLSTGETVETGQPLHYGDVIVDGAVTNPIVNSNEPPNVMLAVYGPVIGGNNEWEGDDEDEDNIVWLGPDQNMIVAESPIGPYVEGCMCRCGLDVNDQYVFLLNPSGQPCNEFDGFPCYSPDGTVETTSVCQKGIGPAGGGPAGLD